MYCRIESDVNGHTIYFQNLVQRYNKKSNLARGKIAVCIYPAKVLQRYCKNTAKKIIPV